jgi:hypothetical protein
MKLAHIEFSVLEGPKPRKPPRNVKNLNHKLRASRFELEYLRNAVIVRAVNQGLHTLYVIGRVRCTKWPERIAHIDPTRDLFVTVEEKELRLSGGEWKLIRKFHFQFLGYGLANDVLEDLDPETEFHSAMDASLVKLERRVRRHHRLPGEIFEEAEYFMLQVVVGLFVEFLDTASYCRGKFFLAARAIINLEEARQYIHEILGPSLFLKWMRAAPQTLTHEEFVFKYTHLGEHHIQVQEVYRPVRMVRFVGADEGWSLQRVGHVSSENARLVPLCDSKDMPCERSPWREALRQDFLHKMEVAETTLREKAGGKKEFWLPLDIQECMFRGLRFPTIEEC